MNETTVKPVGQLSNRKPIPGKVLLGGERIPNCGVIPVYHNAISGLLLPMSRVRQSRVPGAAKNKNLTNNNNDKKNTHGVLTRHLTRHYPKHVQRTRSLGSPSLSPLAAEPV